jgi:hypothetical protein
MGFKTLISEATLFVGGHIDQAWLTEGDMVSTGKTEGLKNNQKQRKFRKISQKGGFFSSPHSAMSKMPNKWPTNCQKWPKTEGIPEYGGNTEEFSISSV